MSQPLTALQRYIADHSDGQVPQVTDKLRAHHACGQSLRHTAGELLGNALACADRARSPVARMRLFMLANEALHAEQRGW